ncbi:MAG: DinB family protein [Dehalococcoidia bacterium]
MVSKSAARLVAQIEARHEPFHAAVQRLKPQDFESATSASWTVKELLGHIAFWDEAVFGFVTSVLRQRELSADWSFGSGFRPAEDGTWPHFDVHNAREAAWARTQPADTVRSRLKTAHRMMVDSVASATEDEYLIQRDYYEGLGSHYLDHLPELEGIVGKQ